MASYLDSVGQSRSVKITMRAVDLVRERMGLNLYDLGHLSEICQGTRKALEVIWTISAMESGEGFEDWFDKHAGDGQANAIDAFCEAIEDFLPEKLARTLRERRQAVNAALEAVFREMSLDTGFPVLSQSPA